MRRARRARRTRTAHGRRCRATGGSDRSPPRVVRSKRRLAFVDCCVGCSNDPGRGATLSVRRLAITAVHGIPEVKPGDDLATLITNAVRTQGDELRDGDVL